MSARLDVRRMLIRRGWHGDVRTGRTGLGVLKGETFWAPMHGGDSCVTRYDLRGTPTVSFCQDTPARAIVACCVALAADRMDDVTDALASGRTKGGTS